VIRGRCLCGRLRFETEAGGVLTCCHCARCRKWTGAAFMNSLHVAAQGFRFVAGREGIPTLDGTPGSRRGHCTTCGSVLPGAPPGVSWVGVPAGLLEGDPGVRTSLHVFARSWVPWLVLDDGAPRFETWPPGFAPSWAGEHPLGLGPPTEWKTPDAPQRARGSCLCGSVRYEVDPPHLRFVHCHCSRCRRATGSAFATNLVVAPERFRWTSGEHDIVRYDLPEARSFANAFCGMCGSTVPHATRSGRAVIVPTGTLDEDPGARPDRHVFWSSRAPWTSAADSLPRHPGAG
jgi:hypothetical protein